MLGNDKEEQVGLSAVCVLNRPFAPSLPSGAQVKDQVANLSPWETPYREFPGQILTGVKASALGSTFHGSGHNRAAVTALCSVSTPAWEEMPSGSILH